MRVHIRGNFPWGLITITKMAVELSSGNGKIRPNWQRFDPCDLDLEILEMSSPHKITQI